MSHFTPLPALLGGLLIGAAASLLWLGSGKVAGISGILGGALGRPEQRGWRLVFLAGLLAGGVVLLLVRPAALSPATAPLPLLAAGGLLVGFGARLGGGCTSGHGVCGLSRLSRRSLIATLTFFASAALVVWLLRLGRGG
jgi:hypothetical protein